MKFLKEEKNKKTKNNVYIEFDPLTTSQQASLVTLAVDTTTAGRVQLTKLILNNIITKIKIDHKEYKPGYIAENADISDPATVDVYFLIASMVMEEALLHAPKKKNIKPLDTLKESGETVESAPAVVKESLQVNA